MIQLDLLERAIEAVLFSSGEPTELEKLSEIVDADCETVRKMLSRIKDKLEETRSGVVLLEMNDSYQLASHPDFAPYVRRALEIRKDMPLSQAALEVLAIVAYNQPVSRSFVEQVRGVDSTAVMNNLVNKGLIEEAGRMNLPGRPISYVTTDTFLRCFGLKGLNSLPPLPKEEEEESSPEE